MICEHVNSVVHAYVDGELDWWTRLQVQAHVRRCPKCAQDLREAQELTRAMRSFRTPMPPHVAHRLRARLAGQIPEPELVALGRGGGSTAVRGPLNGPRRRLLTGAAAAAAAIAGIAVLATKGQAGHLQETMDAMALTGAAYAAGELTSYRQRGVNGEIITSHAHVEYWFRAPGDYLQLIGGVEPGSALVPSILQITPDHGTLTVVVQGRRFTSALPPTDRPMHLVAFDIFSASSLLRQVLAEKDAQVRTSAGESAGRSVDRFEVTSHLASWTLDVDPHSHLVIRAECVRNFEDHGKLMPSHHEVLSTFRYGSDVPPRPKDLSHWMGSPQ